MHAEIGRMSKLQRAFLNIAFQYGRFNDPQPADTAISKQVLKHIKEGRNDLAAIEAGKSQIALEIFEKALEKAKGE
jgi:hypothetical protein